MHLLPEDWFERLIEATLDGVGLGRFAASLGVSEGVVRTRFLTDDTLCERYIRAQRLYFQLEGMTLLQIADECSADVGAASKARLQIDTRKWLMGRLLPKLYGNHITIDGEGVATPLIVSESALAALAGISDTERQLAAPGNGVGERARVQARRRAELATKPASGGTQYKRGERAHDGLNSERFE